MVFVFLYLTYITGHNILQVHPCCCKWQHVRAIFKVVFIYLCSFGSPGSSLLHAGFLQLQQGGAALPCGPCVSHCVDFFCCRAQALSTGSVVVAYGLSCPVACQGPARPGVEPVCPTLSSRFPATRPPGKSMSIFNDSVIVHCVCVIFSIKLLMDTQVTYIS